MGIASIGLWLLWVIFQAGHWFTATRDGVGVPIEGGAALLNRTVSVHFEGDGEPLTKMAVSLSMVITIFMLAVGISLAFKVARAAWRLAHAAQA
jgi:hypothetical protein